MADEATGGRWFEDVEDECSDKALDQLTLLFHLWMAWVAGLHPLSQLTCEDMTAAAAAAAEMTTVWNESGNCNKEKLTYKGIMRRGHYTMHMP